MMNLSLPPLASLRAFEAVARLGSVKLASESLHLTPSAISHQIRTLEAHFGVQLVERNGRNIVLTESGSVYATALLSAFNELFRANELLDARKRDKVIRVSVTPTFATLAALPKLETFRSLNAHLDLRLEARNTAVSFEKDSIHAAVQIGTPPFPGLIFHRLMRSRAVPCAGPKLLDSVGDIRNTKDLARLPLIEYSTVPNNWPKWFAANDPSFTNVESALLADSLLTSIQMTQSGMGVILAPFPLVSPLVTSGALKPITLWPPMESGERDFYFTYRKVDAVSEKIKAVHTWLKMISGELESESTALGI